MGKIASSKRALRGINESNLSNLWSMGWVRISIVVEGSIEVLAES